MKADIPVAFAVNFLGELLMLTMLVCNVWRLKGRNAEARLLRILVACAMAGCAVDAITFACDQTAGTGAYLLSVASNTFLYADELAVCFCWVLFIQIHMRGPVGHRQLVVLLMPFLAGLALIIANIFVPLIFSVDSEAGYSRLPLFQIITAFAYTYFVYAFGLYIHLRRRTGSLRLFKGWVLMLPVLAGGSFELLFPAYPLFWATVSIGVAGTITSLQNEDIYRDRLTGLYNRTYLEYVSSGGLGDPAAELSGIMIDLNGFKQINDRFGHNVGDEALKDAADLLRRTVGDNGLAARYAGDEFVVLLSTRDEAVVKALMTEIRYSFQSFDMAGKRPYHLSASMGWRPLLPGQQTVEEFIAAIDHAMYADKRRYYEKHPGVDRRSRDA